MPSLDLTALATQLQARVNALTSGTSTDEILALSLIIDATTGNVELSDIQAAAATNIASIEAARTAGIAAVNSAADAKLAEIGQSGSGSAAATSFTPTGTIAANTVQAAIAEVALEALQKTGGTLTGALTLAGDPTLPLHPASKQYVDNALAGLDVKGSVKAGTTANIVLSGAQTIDGVTLGAGDRVLVKDQTTPAQNGIYVVNAGGAWARSTDTDAWTELVSAFTLVEQGTVNGDVGFTCKADAGGTLGTSPVPWEKFGTLAGLAPLGSPAFTGVPTVPTAIVGTNTDQASSTAFVIAEILARALAKAAGSDVRTGTDDTKFLTSKALYDAMLFVTDAYAATYVPNFNSGFNRQVVLTGNMTLGQFTNGKDGEPFVIEFVQDNTGSRTLAFNTTYWKIPPALTITASTTGGAKDKLFGQFRNRSGTMVAEVAGYDKALP